MKVFVTEYIHSERGFWEQVDCKTMRGAKCAATRRSKYHGSTVMVGIQLYDDYPIEPVAEKPWNGEWRELHSLASLLG